MTKINNFVCVSCGNKFTPSRNRPYRNPKYCSRRCYRTRSHGHASGGPSSEYGIWCAMKRRCLNKNAKKYKIYGKIGISICERWMKFENFLEDMGERPSGKHQIDRTDNNGNYEPENCKWVTPKQNCRNTRRNRMIKFNGREQCLTAWAEELNFSVGCLKGRLKKYPPEIAFTKPLEISRRNKKCKYLAWVEAQP